MQPVNPQSPPDQPRLSKSKIAALEHCPRRLWLQVHRRELGQFDEGTLALFQCGHYVGELARHRYAQGYLVAEDHLQIPAAIARTQELLAATIRVPIFEAAFERDGVIIRADILEPDNWGGWRLIEVKNARDVRSYQVRDVATQAWVIQGNALCLSAAIVRHVERPLRATSRNPTVRFVDADVTTEAQRLVKDRQAIVNQARSVLEGGEPGTKPSGHCARPSCEFRQHCFGQAGLTIVGSSM
jgi:CRISPR/Cas system-associated exonuclease Cas4 (RecB family)